MYEKEGETELMLKFVRFCYFLECPDTVGDFLSCPEHMIAGSVIFPPASDEPEKTHKENHTLLTPRP